ncbi:MAG: cupredoxin domain-containing protein [Patescibacteria group bacterium]|nr:cupredoxin domain-containing protein [Patescibacteria group bacterium]
MNNKFLLIIAAIVILLGEFYLLGNKTKNNQINQTAQKQPATQTKPVEGKAVTATNKGFEPQTITIKTGQRVVWTNKSGSPVTVNSDVHPTHLLWPFLNLGQFADGASVSVVFEKAGKYTYHNHLNASQTGIVTVE